MHESFALLVCTKEDLSYFKVANPSESTSPAKVKTPYIIKGSTSCPSTSDSVNIFITSKEETHKTSDPDSSNCHSKESSSFISKENKTRYYSTYIMGGDGGLCSS